MKLLDFGIARAATGLSNYKEGMLMGKLGYVAPEQASLDRPWDHRVDIFAAGIILYELLTKQKPFQRAVDVESLIQSRLGKVVPPSSIDDRLPKDLDTIVLRALAANPDDRYPDARSFGDALVDVLFPTPHSAVQDHLGRQMHAVYAERIARQRAARAHDALVMKVLRNVADQQRAAVYDSVARAETTGPLPISTPLSELGTESIDIDVDRSPRAPVPARPGAHPHHPGGRRPGRPARRRLRSRRGGGRVRRRTLDARRRARRLHHPAGRADHGGRPPGRGGRAPRGGGDPPLQRAPRRGGPARPPLGLRSRSPASRAGSRAWSTWRSPPRSGPSPWRAYPPAPRCA